MVRLLALLALFASLSVPARANPSMSADFDNMMGWLSHEVVQGLAFNAGETFDPPNEIRPWRIQPDVSLGIGVMPLNKTRFPTIGTPALAEKNPAAIMPSEVKFPNLALHLRLGLPGRMDFTVRGANMTVPKGYKMSKLTASGQSNSFGFGLRKHLLGGRDMPLLSLGANYNHVRGKFNYTTAIDRLELSPGFFVDSQERGSLEWNVNSIGANAVLSQTFGIWTPFAGLGWNYMTGSLRSRLQADFASPLIAPSVGEASAHPEAYQTRFLFGTQLDRSRFSMFLSGEVKASGENAGKTFIVSMGFSAPFRIGSSSLAARDPRHTDPAPVARRRKAEPEPKFREPAPEAQTRWAELPADPLPGYYRAPRAAREPYAEPKSEREPAPQLIFLR